MWERIRVMAPCWIAAVFCIASLGLAKEPRSPEDYLRRGIERYTATDYDGAIEDFTNAIVVNSSLDSRAVKRIKQVRSSPSSDASSDSSEKFLVIDRLNATLYFWRGNAYGSHGEPDKAGRDFDRAIELDKNLFDAYLNRGRTLTRLGKDTEAEKDFAYCRRQTGGRKDTLDKLVQEARVSRLPRK